MTSVDEILGRDPGEIVTWLETFDGAETLPDVDRARLAEGARTRASSLSLRSASEQADVLAWSQAALAAMELARRSGALTSRRRPTTSSRSTRSCW